MKEEIDAILNNYVEEYDFIHNMPNNQFAIIRKMLEDIYSVAYLEGKANDY